MKIFPKKIQWQWVLVIFLVIAIGLTGRFYRLDKYPAGLHQDEAWFAYNAFLLMKDQTNIYGQKWPLTVDMWGDQVPAIHSYVLVPFIKLFGVNTFAFRSGIVSMGILAAVVVLYWLYRQTKNEKLVLLMGLMIAMSPWAIVMSRASSSVMIDSFALALLVLVDSVVLDRALKRKKRGFDAKLWLGSAVVYLLSIACYVTYFTSRLLVPPYLVALGIYFWWTHRKSWRLQITLGVIVPVVAYLIFPFATYLMTPYALGRFEQTAVTQSTGVNALLTHHISQSGEAGLPTWLTRVRFNKVTEVVTLIWEQYIGLLSPSVLLFHNGPPARYEVPNGLSVTVFEYFGVLFAAMTIFLWRVPSKDEAENSYLGKLENTDVRPFIWLTLFFTLTAAVPSALTKDDFPNLQRAVIMVPWFQVTSALGWFVVLQQWLHPSDKVKSLFNTLKKQVSSPIGITILVLLLSAPSLFSFWFGYIVQTPYELPIHRSRAGEELAKWINANAHDAKIIEDHVEGVFFYPYLFAAEDFRKLPIQKTGKYFLDSRDFWIGNRHFVADLCSSKELHEQKYDYYIFYVLNDRCRNADGMVKVFEAKYDDGHVGFGVYKQYVPPGEDSGQPSSS